MNYIAAIIHNHKLGLVVGVEDEEIGKELIREWVRVNFDRELTDAESSDLDSNLEFYNDSDGDNTYTFAVAAVE